MPDFASVHFHESMPSLARVASRFVPAEPADRLRVSFGKAVVYWHPAELATQLVGNDGAAPVMSRLPQRIDVLAVQDILQVLSVLVLLEFFVDLEDILPRDPAIQIGDLLKACNLAMLVLLNGLHEIRRLN